jgi:hypothetical protein
MRERRVASAQDQVLVSITVNPLNAPSLFFRFRVFSFRIYCASEIEPNFLY